MLHYHIDTIDSILTVHPESPLEKEDFVALAETVDPHIAAAGDLAGLIIEAPEFPGWASLGAMVSHFRFVRDHHKHIKKVALVTDSALGDAAERLASHFVAAEIKHFPAGHAEAAREWVMQGDRAPAP